MRYYLAALWWTVVSCLPGLRPCDDCGGYGQIYAGPGMYYEDCLRCQGRGRR